MQVLLVPADAGPFLGGVLVLLLVVALGAALLRARAQLGRERDAARAADRTVAELRAEVAEIQRRLATPGPTEGPGPHRSAEFVITHLGETSHPSRPPAAQAPGIEPVLFADLVLRESVVRAASLAHGIRVALAPETRHRIRFEVRREVRRARRQRRAETRLARRELASRQRAALPDDPDNEDAA